MNLEQHILRVLGGVSADARPVTMGDLSREFGVSVGVLLPVAHRLVTDGLAVPAMVAVRGVPTLRGLRPVPRPAGDLPA